MKVTTLRYLVAFADEGSFSRAAERCQVSQPTLSVALQQFESELAVSLIERSKAHVALTDLGRQVVAQAQEAMANIAAVLAEADARVSGTMFDPARLDYTVYVRHASEIAQVQAALGALIPAASEVLFVEADICRSDLLVEIEAWGQATIAGEAA